MTHDPRAPGILGPYKLRQLTEAGLVVLPADTPRSLPAGVTIADDQSGELRYDETWTVLVDGEQRTLRLTLARGVLR